MDNKGRTELIVRTAAKLSDKERMEVIDRISSIQGGHTEYRDRFEALVAAAEKATGWRMARTRDYGSVMIRRFVAWRMKGEGFRVADIADAMGMDHSSVTHYIRMMRAEFDMPNVFRNEIVAYTAFEAGAEEAAAHVE